jgi:hypothetical protein
MICTRMSLKVTCTEQNVKSPLHIGTDDSPVKGAVTSTHDNIPHEYRSGFEKDSGSPRSETARTGGEDAFRLYLAE